MKKILTGLSVLALMSVPLVAQASDLTVSQQDYHGHMKLLGVIPNVENGGEIQEFSVLSYISHVDVKSFPYAVEERQGKRHVKNGKDNKAAPPLPMEGRPMLSGPDGFRYHMEGGRIYGIRRLTSDAEVGYKVLVIADKDKIDQGVYVQVTNKELVHSDILPSPEAIVMAPHFSKATMFVKYGTSIGVANMKISLGKKTEEE